MSKPITYKDYTVFLTTSESQIHLQISDETSMSYYECFFDQEYITSSKFIPDLYTLEKLLITCFENKYDTCKISEIVNTYEGIRITIDYSSILTFTMNITLKRVDDESQTLLIKRELVKMANIIKQQSRIIDELQKKTQIIDLSTTKSISNLWIPVFRNNGNDVFIPLIIDKLTISCCLQPTGKEKEKQRLYNPETMVLNVPEESRFDFYENLKSVVCKTLEINYNHNIVIPYIPKSINKLILTGNANVSSLIFDMFDGSCENLTEIEFKNFQIQKHIDTMFSELVKHSIIEPSKVKIQITNSSSIHSSIPTLERLGFSVVIAII